MNVTAGTCVTYNYLEKPVLNWLADPPDTSTQQIQFGENLIDIAVTKDADETYTACVPLGSRMSDHRPAYESDARRSPDVNDGDPHLIDSANGHLRNHLCSCQKPHGTA